MKAPPKDDPLLVPKPPVDTYEKQSGDIAHKAELTAADIKSRKLEPRPQVPLRVQPPLLMGRLLGAGCVLLILLAWYLVTRGATSEERFISALTLPSPAEVLASFPSLVRERELFPSIGATLDRVLRGFGLAILVGVPMGIVAGSFPGVRAFLAPVEIFGRNIPVAALIPLTFLWFGIDELQKYMFIFMASVPFVFYDSATAVGAVPQRFVETAETLGASRWQIISKVLIPLSMPDIYNSLRLLFGLAFGYIMLAELVNTEQGLGALLNISQRRGFNQDIFAILIIIGSLAYGIDRLLIWFQRGFFPWRVEV